MTRHALRTLLRALRVAVPAALVVALWACGPSARSHRELLALQQQCDSGLPLTDDSLATALAAAFDRGGSANERMQAHYLLALTCTDRGDAPRALDEFHTAADCADTTAADCDYLRLMKIYGQMGELLYGVLLFQDAIDAYQRSYRYGLLAGDTVDAVVAFSHKAKCYYLLNEDSTAWEAEKESVRMFLHIGDTLSSNTQRGSMAYTYIQRRQLDSAAYCLQLYEHQSNLSEEGIAAYDPWKMLYYDKGALALAHNETDSAICYFQKLLSDSRLLNNRALACKGLAQAYEMRGEKDSLAKYAMHYAVLNDSTVNLTISKTLLQMKALHNYSRFQKIAEAKERETERRTKQLVFLAILIPLIAAIAFLLVSTTRKASKERIRSLNAAYVNDLTRYAALNATLKQQNTGYSAILQETTDELNTLRKSIAQRQTDQKMPDEWGVSAALLSSKVIGKFHKMAFSTSSPSEADWRDLSETVSKAMPGFTEALAALKHSLKPRETQLCILLKLRFTTSEISSLLNISPQALSNLRRRLLKSMFGKEGGAYEFDKLIWAIDITNA